MNHPPFKRTRQPSTPLERGLFRLFRVSTRGSAIIITWFLGYLLVGIGLHMAGIYNPRFAIMSFSDPFFIISGFLGGGFICVMSGSLTLLTLLLDAEDANAAFVILMSLVAFGFGAATMRVTLGPVHAFVAELGAL